MDKPNHNDVFGLIVAHKDGLLMQADNKDKIIDFSL